MATTLKVGPVTRLEGHLDIEVSVDRVNNVQQVVDAKSTGTMFRGFENILKNRDPLDATHYTQRICGVCPISHGMASSLNLESAFGLLPPDNGRILRNLILGSNFLQSHILHFYHLAALDYIDTTGLLDMSPWNPHWVSSDMLKGSDAAPFIDHYVQALTFRRKAHQLGAIFGGKLPCSPTLVPGGCTAQVTQDAKTKFLNLLHEISDFIDGVMIPDVEELAAASQFAKYFSIGKGCGNLLAYGVFDLNAQGTSKLLARGRYTNGALATVDPNQIKEYVAYSWYTANSGNRNPASGVTEPQLGKSGAYSFLKSPRYNGAVHEVGPLARMWVNGDYRHGISVLDRIMARALEAQKIADAMAGWANQLAVGKPVYQAFQMPIAGSTGMGLTEAPRGALGHWMTIGSNGRIASYQIVTPTGWNASPKDDAGKKGPLEQALIGTPVADLTQPIELLRVVHSFDPCLACSVHMVRPDGKKSQLIVGLK